MTKKRPDQQRLNEHMDRIRATVLEHGWMVQGVFAVEGDPEPGFAYTIGLTDAGLPELLITGSMNPQMWVQLLNTAAEIHIKDEIVPGAFVTGVANVGFQARAVQDIKPLQQALNYYRDALNERGVVRAVQLVWPDDKGFFPESPFYNQTMLQPLP